MFVFVNFTYEKSGFKVIGDNLSKKDSILQEEEINGFLSIT